MGFIQVLFLLGGGIYSHLYYNKNDLKQHPNIDTN